MLPMARFVHVCAVMKRCVCFCINTEGSKSLLAPTYATGSALQSLDERDEADLKTPVALRVGK